jgi:hypothetical protein
MSFTCVIGWEKDVSDACAPYNPLCDVTPSVNSTTNLIFHLIDRRGSAAATDQSLTTGTKKIVPPPTALIAATKVLSGSTRSRTSALPGNTATALGVPGLPAVGSAAVTPVPPVTIAMVSAADIPCRNTR